MLVMYFSIFIKVEWHCSCKNTYFERSVAGASFIPIISTHTLVMQETTRCWCFQWNHWWVHFGRIPQLTGSLNLRDPSTCDLAGSHSQVSYPIHAALRLTEGGKFDPNAASGSSRASFQNCVNLRIVVVFALKDKRGIQSPVSQTSIFLLAFSLIPVTGSLRLKNPSCCYRLWFGIIQLQQRVWIMFQGDFWQVSSLLAGTLTSTCI